jgi:hypothetical protein
MSAEQRQALQARLRQATLRLKVLPSVGYLRSPGNGDSVGIDIFTHFYDDLLCKIV